MYGHDGGDVKRGIMEKKSNYPRVVKISDSSHLSRVYYDPKSGKMIVRFQNGAEYLYENVGHEVFGALVAADSTGKAFNELVRGGTYKFKKLVSV